MRRVVSVSGEGFLSGRLRLATVLGCGVCAAALIAPVSAAWAQAQPAARTAARPAPRPEPVDDDDDPSAVSEITVTAGKTLYQTLPGAVVGDVAPDLQLSPADIQSYGVSTVTELLDELAPQTRSDQGRGGETPVVLLNGRRISGFNEIRDIPTEAVLRVDILPEEVALKYGFTAAQRVVNIVLRPRFRAITAEGRAGAQTGGGSINGQAEGDDFRVRGDNRLNLDIKVNGNSALTENERDLTSISSTQPYALGGNVVSTVPGGQIDPALSLLAGRPVTAAGIPAAAGSRPLALQDFLGAANSGDIGRYRTLTAAAQSLSLNAVAAKALANGWSSTLNASLSANSSQGLRGLPTLALTVPVGDPFSPFGSIVKVDRYVDGLGPLRQDSSSWSGHFGNSLNRDLGKWRLSITGAYDHNDSRTVSDIGVSAAALQALLSARSRDLNPFVAPLAGQLTLLGQNRARSISDSGNLQVLANGPLIQAWAGPLTASFKAGDSQSGFSTSSVRLGATQSLSFSRNDLTAQMNLDLPLSNARKHVLPIPGDLSVNANLAVDQLSGFGALTTLGYGLNWKPVTGLTLIVSRTRDEQAPSVQQLGNPTIVTAGVRILDFATGQTVDVNQIAGGNPALRTDHRDVFKAGLTWKPVQGRDFTITANYIATRTDNPIQTFPAATAQIEAAFPDRFLRDDFGQLFEVDNRPVNFAYSDRREIRWGVNYSRPISKPPQRPVRPPPGPDGQPRRARRDGQPAPPDGQANPPAAAQADGQAPSAPPARAAGGGGPGGGRGGFGGGRFGGGGGQPQGRFQVALYHTLYFTNEMLVRPGGPLLDLLNGAAMGNNGGQPQHQVEAQLGYTENNVGARFSANWTSGTTVQSGSLSSTGNLTFSDLATVNLRLFANAGAMRSVVQRHPWLRGTRITLNVFNLFDQRIQVVDATGRTPISFQPAYLDPAGRTVSLSVRKLFF